MASPYLAGGLCGVLWLMLGAGAASGAAHTPAQTQPYAQVLGSFTLADMSVTSTGIANQPTSSATISKLRAVCQNVLEPVLEHFGKPVIMHSGYRSPAVNKAVGGSSTSQHSKGEAADFHVSGVTVLEVAQWLSESDLEYDQLIFENFVPGRASSGWVHCSFSVRNRNMNLTKFKGSSKYYPGILEIPHGAPH